MKKVAAALCILVLIFSLSACGKGEAQETDLIAEARVLVDEAYGICGKIYSNAGLTAMITEENEGDKYMPVDSEVLTSIQKIKDATKLYFTEEVAETILFPSAFDGDEPMYIEQNGTLMVNTEKRLEAWRTAWDFDSAVITEQTDTSAVMRMKVIVSDVEAGQKSLTISKGDDGHWRLACTIG